MNRSTTPSHDSQPCLPPEEQTDAQRIAALHSYAILDTPREPEFDDIVQMAAQACATPMAHINFIDAGRQWIKAAVGHDVQEMPLHLGFCTDALAECDILLLPDLVADPERAENPLVTGAPHLRFYAGVPLKTPDGLAIGTLCVLDRVPRTLNDQQIFILKALARTVMAQLETRRSDAASRRSEARYHALFNSIDAGFCIIEMRFDAFGQPVDYRFVNVNAAFEEQTNLKDATGRWMRDLAPDHEQHWFDTFGRVATTGESIRFENAAEALGRWYDVQAYRIDEPASHRVAVLFNDISDRRRMELALRGRESELRLVADAMPVLIAFVDRSFTYRFANAAYENWFGRSPATIIGRPVMEMLDADEFAVRRPYMEQAFAGSEARIERSWPWPDGRARVAEIRYLPRRDPDGQIGGFYVFVQDITERKHDEQRLVSRAEQLEGMVAAQMRDRDRVWTLSPVLKVVAARDGRVQSVNPSWTQALGWSEAETVGRSVIEFVPFEDREQAVADLRGVILGLPAKDIEVSVATKETGTRRISWTIVPEDDLLYGFGRDITEQRQAEEALRQSQKLEAVGQLTGGVAHDFNNLLTIIRSSVDFLRRPELPEERKRRYLDAVSDTVDRAAKLTGQLLAFARRQALKPEVFEVGARLRSVADMLDTIAGTRIRIVTQVPEDPCFVRADLSQFETALVNMAVNARDAMDGEGTLRLRLTAASDMPAIRGHAGAPGPFAAIALTDTGTGIASDQIGRVFEPFFTTKEVGRGTGLGLSQVFGFAKQSGGDVSVESALGEGTTFTLYLPEIQSEVRRDQDIKHDLDFAAVGAGQRLLVVEDNVEVGRFATQILQDLGYETTWAVNAEEALDKLGTDGSGFDLVFSDVVMPGMGGIALAKELRRRLPDLPVVLASGYSHVLAQDDAHGFELLHKPYSAEQLSRILQRVARVAEPSRTT